MIIGIGGVSRAGKTTLSARLLKRLKGITIKVFNQDDFVKKQGLPLIKNHIDWEHPDSIDWKNLKKRIRADLDNYDLILVEGLFAFYDKMLVRLFDHSIFVQIDKETFFNRKRKDMRWGKEPEWFIRHIWASYIKYGRIPKKIKQIIIINGSTPADLEPLLRILNIIS